MFLLYSFLITFATTPIIIWWAKRHQMVDDSRRRHPAKTHEGSIPRAGGLSIYIGIVVVSLLFLPFSKVLWGILLGGLLTVIVGLWDDYKDLSPYLRLILNILCALIVIAVGVGVPFITNPFGGIIHMDQYRISFDLLGPHSILVIADVFAVLWIVYLMNSVGWSAGIDGQLPGFVTIAAIIIAILSSRFGAHDISQDSVRNLSLITAGAFLGFLPWNFYPQKIMPGYGGKSLAGFLLAVLSILSGAKVGTALLVLGLPLSDGIYTLSRRILSKRSPFKADRGHLHHKLLDLGWGKRRIAVFYWLITLILGIIALSVSSGGKLFAFIFVVVALGIFLVVLKLLHLFSVFP